MSLNTTALSKSTAASGIRQQPRSGLTQDIQERKEPASKSSSFATITIHTQQTGPISFHSFHTGCLQMFLVVPLRAAETSSLS